MTVREREPLPSWADWQGAAGALGLRMESGELVGPCPSCDGDNRFHIRRRGPDALVGCRGCIDGGGTGFGAVLRAAFPERFDRERPVRRPESASVPFPQSRTQSAPGPRNRALAAFVAREGAIRLPTLPISPLIRGRRLWRSYGRVRCLQMRPRGGCTWRSGSHGPRPASVPSCRQAAPPGAGSIRSRDPPEGNETRRMVQDPPRLDAAIETRSPCHTARDAAPIYHKTVASSCFS